MMGDGLLRRFAPLRKRFAFVAGNDDGMTGHHFACGTQFTHSVTALVSLAGLS
jgi:hypothetical protein